MRVEHIGGTGGLFPDDLTGNLAATRREHNTIAYGLAWPAVLELKRFDADLWCGAAVLDAMKRGGCGRLPGPTSTGGSDCWAELGLQP
ncbi:hypothetical protein [Ancylobacter sp. FA202]|uniref:hypothetical protein n=1 Tax=Ancylobacter sp. FA202 TaxID=1111106 RepID=UPI00037A8FF0|nr:hypothetical protein [Ancylobacter sp. FA202]